MKDDFKNLLRQVEGAGFRIVETGADFTAHIEKGGNVAYLELNEGLGSLAHLDNNVCLSCGAVYDMSEPKNDLRDICDCGGELVIQGDFYIEI